LGVEVLLLGQQWVVVFVVVGRVEWVF
jgi:hypothetical protein